jgi:tetratricopeptide (TPR) repeat protein
VSPESVPPVPLPPFPSTPEGHVSAPSPTAPLEQPPKPGVILPQPAPRPGVLDALWAVLVCALAFLLASTPARNSDLWLHLASGRLLFQGLLPWGTDPFASTTAGVYWVNPTWLSDAALYGLHQLGGGRALVVAKAVLVTVLAGLLFCFRRRGTRVGLLSLAAAGAVLALGPWLLLQPTLLSLVGVVLTLLLLERPALVEGAQADRARALRWLLVPLFALWANLDGWFILGPVLVGLYALGEGLRRLLGGAGGKGDLGALVLLTLAGLAACLLTPSHYHTFGWPMPLGWTHAEQVWMRDPLGQGLVVSPFGPRFISSPAFASPGVWAYYLLLGAGLASFILRGRAVHPGRLLVWLALAALSIYQARAIPFFAVAAGPLLALNLQESARPVTLSPLLRRLQMVVLGIGALAGVGLLVLAWPGWLQPAPYQPRAWTAEPDGSLARLARHLLEKGPADEQFPPMRFTLTFSPDAAHHLAWFYPPEKGFLDSRWPLFDRVAEDYVRMRRYLLPPEGAGPDRELGPLLDAYHIDRILLYDPDWERTTRAYRCLLRDGEEWELLALEGNAMLFGRRSGAESPSPWKALDRRWAAYHPGPDHRAPPTPLRLPQPPGHFDPFFRAREERSPDRAEAALHLIYFDLAAERMRADLGRQWLLAQATGLVGLGPGSEAAGTAGAVAVRLDLTPLLPSASPAPAAPAVSQDGPAVADQFAVGFLASRDQGPPEALLLAVRAARRALADHPEDAGAYLLLGEAYLRLARQTREQSWHGVLPNLAGIRQAQVLTALEQAVLFRPDLDQAHALLAQLYRDAGQMDRALDHSSARLRIAEQEAKKPGPGARPAAERLPGLQAQVEEMTALVRQAEQIYVVNSEDLTDPSKVFERARLAARHGLSRKALEMLLGSHPAKFGKAGALMQLDLMMQAGRAFDIRAWLEPEHESVLGPSAYHWLQVHAAAACGDYARADAELDVLSEELRQIRTSPEELVPVRSVVALRVAGAVLAHPALGAGPTGLAGTAFQEFDAVRPLGTPISFLRQEADVRVLRGLLALESGDVETSRRYLRAALDVWGGDSQAAAGAGVDFFTRPIAEQTLHLLEGAAR